MRCGCSIFSPTVKLLIVSIIQATAAAIGISITLTSVTAPTNTCESGSCPSKMTLVSASIKHIPAKSLYVTKPVWWLESRLHFSFAEYWDEKRMNFGALRVFNDDLVKPRAGFGAHPHRDAEIFSYVVAGKLSHRDSMGNTEALGRGCVQYLSAGTGITHSEMNEQDVTCRFLQVWFMPDRRGHRPQYGSSSFAREERHNRLLHILGGTGELPDWPGIHSPHSIKLNQDANVFVSECDAGTSFDLRLGPQRQAYLMCIEGSLQASSQVLSERDAAEVVGGDGSSSSQLQVKALDQGAHFIILEMAKQ